MLDVLALSAALLASPQPDSCPPLRARSPHGNYIVPGVLGNVAYRGDLGLDIYVQPGGGRRPLVIVVHGGEWTSGSRFAHVGQLLELLTRAGYHWASIDYRLGGLDSHRQAVADVRGALEFVHCRATGLRADPERIVLLGEDAGAQLVAMAAAGAPGRLAGAVLIGGLYDLARTPFLAKRFSGDLLVQASPVSGAVRGMPPLLVVHGGADEQVPVEQAREYCGEVGRAGGSCDLVEVAGASHRAENWWPSQWSYKDAIVQWLKRVAPAGPPVRTAAGAGFEDGLRKNVLYDEATGLRLDVFRVRARQPTPAVIVVHGGGWEAGDKVTYVTPAFEPLAAAGLTWFSIDYRLTPAHTHVEQLEDVRAAIRFVRTRHREYNVDPSRIFLLGESASAQMVAQIATEDRELAGVVAFYGVYDFPAVVKDASPRSLLVRLFRRAALDDEALDVLRRFSPLYTAHERLPPILLIAGTADRLWPQTEAFARRLTALGVAHEVIALQGAPHGMENWEGQPQWTAYKTRMTEWIRRVAGVSTRERP